MVWTITSIADHFASLARMRCDALGEAKDVAVDHVLGDALGGHASIFGAAVTSDTMEVSTLFASVATDALENTHRPSIGFVRDYILGQV